MEIEGFNNLVLVDLKEGWSVTLMEASKTFQDYWAMNCKADSARVRRQAGAAVALD